MVHMTRISDEEQAKAFFEENLEMICRMNVRHAVSGHRKP